MARPPRIQFDPFALSPEGRANPYPLYARLRDVPVFRTDVAGRDVYGVAGYKDVMAGLADHQRFSAADGLGLDPRDRWMAGVLVLADPPEHGRIKHARAPLMTPTVLTRMQPEIRRVADELVARMLDYRTFDVIHDLAKPLTPQVVGDFVGLPDRSRELWHSWAATCTSFQGPYTPAEKAAAFEQLEGMGEYINWLTTEGPTEVTEGRVAAGVFKTATEGKITHDEAVNLIWGAMIIAGLHSSVAFFGHLFRALTIYPHVWDDLAGDPDLAPDLVDEIVRWESPIQWFFGTAKEGAQVGGLEIPAGRRVMLGYGPANHDPRQWGAPRDCRRAPDEPQHPRRVRRRTPLLRLEATAVLQGLAACGVAGFQLVGEPALDDNTMVRGHRSVQVSPLRSTAPMPASRPKGAGVAIDAGVDATAKPPVCLREATN